MKVYGKCLAAYLTGYAIVNGARSSWAKSESGKAKVDEFKQEVASYVAEHLVRVMTEERQRREEAVSERV